MATVGRNGERKRRHRPRAFGSVRQLPSGSWNGSYRLPGGGTRSKTFATKLEAEAWLAGERIGAPREAAGLAAVAPVEAGMVTLADYSAQWIAQGGRRGHLAPRTAAEYGRLRSRFLLPAFGRSPLAEITPAQVRAWYGRLGEQAGPTARKQAYSLLASIMSTAAEDELIPASPCRVRGVYKPSRARVTVLTLGEYAALLEATPERFRAMVALATLCGLRQGEGSASCGGRT